jgi:hypothetical protein
VTKLEELNVKRQEDNLLTFVASRQARVLTLELPSIANRPFDVKHGLNVISGSKVRYQVIQASAPVILYSNPNDLIGVDFIRLRATAAGGTVRVLFTVDEGDSFTLKPTTTSWISPPFSASDYNSNGGTLTVSAGNVTTFDYQWRDFALLMTVVVQNATLVGTPDFLTVKLPDNLVTAHRVEMPCLIRNNGTYEAGQAISLAGDTFVRVYRGEGNLGALWSAGSGNTEFRFQITVPTTA